VRRQRIGDRAAGTVVTRTGRPGGARLAALAAALVLGVMLGGAGVLLRSPAVASVSVTATLARDATREHQAVDPTTRFPPSAGAFVVVFRAEGGKSGDEVKSVWYAVDVGNAALPNTRIDEAGVTLDAPDQAGTFRLRRGQNPWPVGQYKVELYVNGDLAETLDFSVAR